MVYAIRRIRMSPLKNQKATNLFFKKYRRQQYILE
jgi:hypothetical protein